MARHRYHRQKRGLCTEFDSINGKRYQQCVRQPSGLRVSVGAFDSKERALLARRLYEHWLTRGFTEYQIPVSPKTVDAI